MSDPGRAGHGPVPPSPALADAVVHLRPFLDADCEAVAEACNDPAIQEFIPVPSPYGIEDAREYIARTRRQWEDGSAASFAMVDPHDHGRLLGAINLRIFDAVGNCGYWVAPWARGTGVAPGALRLVSDWAFGELDLAMVILEIREENSASISVATKAGFRRAGRIDINDVTLEKGGLIFVRSVADRTV